MAKTDPMEAYLNQLLDRLADRLATQLGGSLKPANQASVAKQRKSSRRGKKLDMSCRVAGCKNRSRGPRFGFICDEHGNKLSKKEQEAARLAWKAKKV